MPTSALPTDSCLQTWADVGIRPYEESGALPPAATHSVRHNLSNIKMNQFIRKPNRIKGYDYSRP